MLCVLKASVSIFSTECWADQVVVVILSAAKRLKTDAKSLSQIAVQSQIVVQSLSVVQNPLAVLRAILAAASL
ncbi:MAG: hypothetical protein VXZ49_07105 [Planctomycetota bacterium]|nr:hypothetical protein [Planctomycetota bacterium]